MQTIRRTVMTFGLAVVCAAGLTAQTQETKTTTNTKIEVKGGKEVTVVGCLERRPNGNYILTDIREKQPGRSDRDTRSSPVTTCPSAWASASKSTGRSLSNGNGKISVESTTKTEVKTARIWKPRAKPKARAASSTCRFSA